MRNGSSAAVAILLGLLCLPGCDREDLPPPPVCGDEQCEVGRGETPERCPEDCHFTCGNGECEYLRGEDVGRCSEDCGWQSVSVGTLHTVALRRDGTVWCWGICQGLSYSHNDRLKPVKVAAMQEVRYVSAGPGSSCAVRPSGTVWCWGFLPHLGSLDVQGVTRIDALHHVELVAAGGFHACALRPGGELWCWGSSHLLGLGDTASGYLLPILVPVPAPVAMLSLDLYSTLVVTEGGEVWGWAWDVGEGWGWDEVPTRMEGISEVIAVSHVERTACALRSDGTVWCWGENGQGQLGIGTSQGPDQCGDMPCSPIPHEVPGLTDVVDVAMGHQFGCALTAAGEVFCWGENSWGQLGVGIWGGPENCGTSGSERVEPCSTVPVAVASLDHVTAIAAGRDSVCAIREDGTMWCWGRNMEGQLGIGTTSEGASAVPVRVADTYE